MNNVHGLVYAYHAFPELGALGFHRTGASLPFCGRFRLIDFTLSGMMNAGISDVGVIMQRGYLSLLEHISNGRSWNLARRSGGLHLLPPYGLADAGKGVYGGCMEALGAMYTYLSEDIREDYVLVTRGDLCANVDINALIEQHLSSDADVTVACVKGTLPYTHHRFTLDKAGNAAELLCIQNEDETRGVASLEMYLLSRERLLEMVRWCREGSRLHFHRDALTHAMAEGCRVGIYLHDGYAIHVTNARDYVRANMDMLDPVKRASLFPPERRVATRARSDASTYFGDASQVRDSLIADGCRIEGTVERCVVFGGVRVAPGAVVRNSIILNDTVIGEHCDLDHTVADKNVTLSPYTSLCGSERLPLLIPKGSIL